MICSFHFHFYRPVLLLRSQFHLAQFVLFMVEDEVAVEGCSTYAGFEVDVFSGGVACLAFEGDDIAWLHTVTFLGEVL